MQIQMENPFSSYTVPDRQNLFAQKFNLEILNTKLTRIVSRVKDYFLEDDALCTFDEGGEWHSFQIDCKQFEPFIGFDSPNAELEFMSQIVIKGINSACAERPNFRPQRVLGVNTTYDAEDPRVASVNLRAISREDFEGLTDTD